MGDIYLNSMMFCYDMDGFIWIYDATLNQLFRNNLNTRETLNVEIPNNHGHIWPMKMWEDYVIMFPQGSLNNVWYVNRRTFNITEKRVPIDNTNISCAQVFDDKIFLLPGKDLRKIAYINLNTNDVEFFQLFDMPESDKYYINKSEMQKNLLIVPILDSPYICQVDMFTQKVSVINCWLIVKRCAVAEQGIYILADEGLYYWDNGNISKIYTLQELTVKDINEVSEIVYSHDRLFILPSTGLCIKVINMANRKIDQYSIKGYSYNYGNIISWNYFYYHISNEKMFMGSFQAPFIIYDFSNEKFYQIDINFPQKYTSDYIRDVIMKEKISEKQLITEHEFCTLESFIKLNYLS